MFHFSFLLFSSVCLYPEFLSDDYMIRHNHRCRSRRNKMLRHDIAKQTEDFMHERYIVTTPGYCPGECCDGYMPVVLRDDVSDNLMCYVVVRDVKPI